MIRRFVIFFLLSVSVTFCSGLSYTFGQIDGGSEIGKGDKGKGKKGDKDKGTTKPPVKPTVGKQTPKPPKNPSTAPPKQLPNQSSNSRAINDCAESGLLIYCGLPECDVSVDGKPQGITSLNGQLQVAAARGKRNIIVSKNGYETMKSMANVACGNLETVNVKLKPKPFELQLKTNLSNCDIFINNLPQKVGQTDENGLFKYRVESGTVYVEARKAGYLADSLSVSPTMAQKEISLKLKPLPARVTLNTDVKDAFAYTEGDEKKYDVTEPISLEPGRRKLIIKALGYAPLTLELDLQPAKKVEKTINLERLPIAGLLAQAEQFLKDKSPGETLKLCNYVFETEPHNAAANRLAGFIYLEKQDYAKAEPYLQKALDGGETIELKIRRHFNEKFELTSGHGAVCEGLLRLRVNEIEYRGLSVTGENFKTQSNQLQIIGLQMKKNVAAYLSLKISDAKGNKKDYNFYSLDKELSQHGKPYLEMIQRLIQRRK